MFAVTLDKATSLLDVNVPIMVTLPEIVPPEELNLLLELSKADWAKTLAEFALLKAVFAIILAILSTAKPFIDKVLAKL